MRWKKSRSASDDTGDLFCVFLPFLAKRTRTPLLVRFSIIKAFQQAFRKRVAYASFAPFLLRLDDHPLNKPSLHASNGRSCLSFSVIIAMNYLMMLFEARTGDALSTEFTWAPPSSACAMSPGNHYSSRHGCLG